MFAHVEKKKTQIYILLIFITRRNKSHIRTPRPAETSRWVMLLSSRSYWQNHLNTSHQIIVVMWTCSAASCDFTWITTTGTKKGQKGNKENKLNLISLKRSERQSQKVFCCDPDKQEIVSMKWDVMPSSFFEDMTLSSLLRLSSRGAERHPSTLKHETWDMKHETWDMRHDTGSCGGAGEANPPWWPPTPSCRESRHNTLFYIH